MLGIIERMPTGPIRVLLVVACEPMLRPAKLGAVWKLARSDRASDVFGRAAVPKKLVLPSRWKKARFDA